MTFEDVFQSYKTAVEAALAAAAPPASLGRVAEAMRYSLLDAGKRVRGILTLACFRLLSEEPLKAALPAAAAVEMVHAYSLIHDDLPCMDDDNLRRGKPSCHVAFGEATALLAGDGLLTAAFSQLSLLRDRLHATLCLQELSEAAGYLGMIRGQQLDLAAEGNGSLSIGQLEDIHAHKTGKLIAAAAVMGIVIAGGDERDIAVIRGFSMDIGLVFQIVDDLLDAVSDANTLGKPVHSDEKRQKSTYVTVVGVERAKKIAESLTCRANEALRLRFGATSRFLTDFSGALLARTK